MTQTTDKLWARILLIALCAALAAGGAFFVSCFGYGRIWRTGVGEGFEESDYAREYVADCMSYLMEYSGWTGVPTEAAARGYGRDSFGCRLLRDGEPVFDTTTDDAVLLQAEVFSRYRDVLVPGTVDEYNEALRYGPIEKPGIGTVVGAYPAETDMASAEYAANGALGVYPAAGAQAAYDASREPAGNTEASSEEIVFLVVDQEYTLEGYVNFPIEPYGGLYAEYMFWNFMLALKDWALPLAVLCLALAAALAFALARDALRRKTEGLGLMTRLPFDVFAAGVIVLTALLALVLRSLGDRFLYHTSPESRLLDYDLLPMLHWMIQAFLWTAAGLLLLRSALARVWRPIEPQLIVSRLSAEARVLFPLGIGVVFQALGFFTRSEGVIAVGLALVLVSGLFSALLFGQLRKLRKASERLAAGELDSLVGASGFWPGVREQAAALGRIGDGIKTAVDEQLKGERLKTELITNVSHDLKTPITSIASCADLLKRPETTPEQAAEYIEMLSRQTQKLRKLTDDLLEASKASSGAIDVQKEPTDVRELLTQSVGEFSERLEQRRITPVLTLPEDPCILDTDGQLLWRILDNLLGNVCKYAQPDTRAYFGLETSPAETVISLKNVSANPLNISAEALMERFVRGDASRSTEGSGLGLSIAQSLTEVLGGTLSLRIDGDLFAAEIRFAPPEKAD